MSCSASLAVRMMSGACEKARTALRTSKPGAVGEHEVEHHEGRIGVFDKVDAGGPSAAGVDLIPLPPQVQLEQLGDRGVVLDHHRVRCGALPLVPPPLFAHPPQDMAHDAEAGPSPARRVQCTFAASVVVSVSIGSWRRRYFLPRSRSCFERALQFLARLLQRFALLLRPSATSRSYSAWSAGVIFSRSSSKSLAFQDAHLLQLVAHGPPEACAGTGAGPRVIARSRPRPSSTPVVTRAVTPPLRPSVPPVVTAHAAAPTDRKISQPSRPSTAISVSTYRLHRLRLLRCV